jgi:hypothetical protein
MNQMVNQRNGRLKTKLETKIEQNALSIKFQISISVSEDTNNTSSMSLCILCMLSIRI